MRRFKWGKPDILGLGDAKRRAAALPSAFPFVSCRPYCLPCSGQACAPVNQGYCSPGYPYYPTTCLPTTVCQPSVPPGCVPRPCAPV